MFEPVELSKWCQGYEKVCYGTWHMRTRCALCSVHCANAFGTLVLTAADVAEELWMKERFANRHTIYLFNKWKSDRAIAVLCDISKRSSETRSLDVDIFQLASIHYS